MNRGSAAIWTKKVFALVMALLLCTGLFAVASAAGDPLKPDDVVSSDGNITLHKQAERTGPDEWEVTVSATVNQTAVEPPPMEVVFVLDTSNSMLGCPYMDLHNQGYFHSHDASCPYGDPCHHRLYVP